MRGWVQGCPERAAALAEYARKIYELWKILQAEYFYEVEG